MKKQSQIKNGIVLSYITMTINMLIQLFYTPVMIRILGQSEYGLYTLVGSVVSYLSLFSLGFTGAYLRFYSRSEKSSDAKAVSRLNGMFMSLFLCMSAVAFVCGMILSQFSTQLFGGNLTEAELAKAKVLMQILVINIALTFPSSIFDSMVSAHEQFLFQRILTLAGIVFNPLICLPLLLMGYGSVAVVTVTTCITLAKLAMNMWFCVYKLRVPFAFDHFDFSLLREIAGFSFFLFLNMIIDQINWSVDKFILGRVAGTGAVAVYGVGGQINSLFIQFSTAVSSVFSPRVNRIAASGEKNMTRAFTDLMIKVGRIQFIIMGLIASGFVIFGHYFVTEIYVTDEYAEAYPVAMLLVLPAVIPLIQNLGIEIQRAVNKHRFRSGVYLAMAIINTLISIPLAYAYGPVGAAAGTAVSLLLANGLIMNVYYHKKIGIDILAFWKSILQLARGLVLPLAFGIIIMRHVKFAGLLSFVVVVLLYTMLYCGSFWCFGMNTEEQELILKPIKRIARRK